jgi:methionyl-tRNA formyltransferase
LLNGDAETGVTIMKMDAGLDTGAILAQRPLAIRDDDNAATLHDRLATLGAELLVESLRDYAGGRIAPQPQDEALATHVGKIRKEEGRMDWTQPARQLWQRVRAFTPWPGAFTHLGRAEKRALLKLWQTEVVGQTGLAGTILSADARGIVVGCGQEALRILSLQREGGRRLTAGEFLAGHPLPPGTRLG